MCCITRVVTHHPFIVIITVIVFSTACLLIPLTTVKHPEFKDPQLGFETRGTEISDRLIAWNNLQDSIKLTGPLTVNPELSRRIIKDNELALKAGPTKFNRRKTQNDLSSTDTEPLSNVSIIVGPKRNYSDDSEDDWDIIKNLTKGSTHTHDHLSPDQFFCSQPGNGYGRVVMGSTDGTDLFTRSSLLSMCILEAGLVTKTEFSSICEYVSFHRCCRSWSLPNYVAMLNNRTSCLNITDEDVRKTKKLLDLCQKYFRDMYNILSDQSNIPSECTLHNTVYNLRHFILDYTYLNSSYSLRNVMVLLPIARSSAALPYYFSLTSGQMSLGNIEITAMDFGLKNALFDECLMEDTKLIYIGAVFVLLCICLYTSSIFLTITTMAGIVFSLAIAYFVYSMIFEIHFFPFMNLLAVIVAIGIGGDASLMVEKIWSCTREGGAPVAKVVGSVIEHSSLCMLVTTITTALAFYSSYISNITAISSFSVFAGTTVVANFFVMSVWTPACLLVSEKLPTVIRIPKLPDWRSQLTFTVLRLRWAWITLFTLIAILSLSVILYSYSWVLPDSPGLQLFASSHPFEQYDSIYRDRFWFERVLRTEFDWTNHNIHMPLRFVWGVLPKDGGNHLDPDSRGKVYYDPSFDLANPDSQAWLKSFCTKLRVQEFYLPTMGPLLSNCFLEVYTSWMEQKCTDPIDGLSRYPCCETSRFPYNRSVFTECATKVAAALYRTPAEIATPGVAGPKFAVKSKSKFPRIKTLVVEYDSNYTVTTSYKDMDRFYRQVESWTKKEMDSAPAGMRGGWFISYLGLYDLQKSLYANAFSALGITLLGSFTVVAVSTRNVVHSLAAAFTISAIVIVTIAFLILLGWRLNILEAVSLSLTIGLSVDYVMEYIINYGLAPEKRSRDTCVSYAITMMSGPTFMAALTTAGAGMFMIPSIVLPYRQIGTLMLVLMVVSWTYSSLFLTSLLSVIGPVKGGRGEYSATELGNLRGGRRKAEHSPSATSATTIVEGESILHPA